MKKVLNRKKVAGSRGSNEPRLVGSIVSEMLQVWNNNTHLGVDLKTQLRSDRYMKHGKGYTGVLRRDIECEDFLYDDHFTFVETVPKTVEKRNPQVYRGKHITVTRKDDGTYSPNFRPVKVGAGFNVGRYAAGVANELLWALEGLVENGPVEEESE